MIIIKIIDLSHLLKTKIPTYPEDPQLNIKDISPQDNSYKISLLKTGTHSGTHIDAPQHYIKNSKNINEIKLENLIGKTTVLKTNTQKKEIKIKHINNMPKKFEKIIILKTKWWENWENPNYFKQNTYPSKELTKYLIKKGIKGIAIDSPSIDSPNSDKNHKILLKNDIWIVENLTKTNQLKNNNYQHAYFIPLNIETEASPIRAFIIE